MYRVIQWATGNVGRAAIDGILAHPELELVGVYVHGPDKEGRDAGELAARLRSACAPRATRTRSSRRRRTACSTRRSSPSRTR